MTISNHLTLPEELLLLVLDDESGAGRSDLALGGGVLAELLLQQLVAIDVEGKKSIVRALDVGGRELGELLAECLNDIRESKKPREASHWVNKFSTKKDLKARTARPLVDRGVLDERKRKILFFELTQFPESNPLPEAELTERLRAAIEHDHISPDQRTVALLVIANAAGLLRNNLDKKMLRNRKDRLKELSEGDHISEAVRAAIAAINAAVIVAVTAGAAASS